MEVLDLATTIYLSDPKVILRAQMQEKSRVKSSLKKTLSNPNPSDRDRARRNKT